MSTYVPASALHTKTKLANTFFTWGTCSMQTYPKQKLTVPKKSAYAKLGHATETYSFGCANGPAVFYGDTYKLENSADEGKTDSFVSTLIGTWWNGGA